MVWKRLGIIHKVLVTIQMKPFPHMYSDTILCLIPGLSYWYSGLPCLLLLTAYGTSPLAVFDQEHIRTGG